MEGHLPACRQQHSAVLLQASTVAQAEHMQAAGMTAADMKELTAGMTAVQEHPEADIRPVLQDCQTSCQGAGECLR